MLMIGQTKDALNDTERVPLFCIWALVKYRSKV